MSAALDLAVELAHDVRSPLGAIMALAELVESGQAGPVTARQRRLLRVVRDAAVSLSQITTDIVTVSRARTAGSSEKKSAFEIQDVLGAVRSMVQPMAEHSGLNVVVTNRAPRMWVGHRTAITRVLLNLTTNALKYTERGTVEYGVRQLSAERIQFFVRDTGGGIVRPDSSGVAPDSPNWKTVGSGLGLAISRRLLDAMGTTLEVESKPGDGSCFRFDLWNPGAAMPARKLSS